MKRSRLLQSLVTRHLVVTVFAMVIVVNLTAAVVLKLQWITLDQFAKYVDAVVKTTALLAGSAWALNRYYVHRTDLEQFRIEADVTKCSFPEESEEYMNLLIYRLDIINTGNVLFDGYSEAVLIESVEPGVDGVKMLPLHRWPTIGYHPGSPIEPGSWAAINDSICIPASTKVVRIFVDIQYNDGRNWTWHKTFSLLSKA